MCIFVRCLRFHIPVVNHAYNVFGKGIAYAYIPAFIAVIKIFGIGSRHNVSIYTLVIVACMNTVAARLVCFSAFPGKVCPPAIFTCICIMFFVAAHIFSTQGKIAKAIACANIPNFFFKRRIGFKVCNISVNIAQCCFNAADINSIIVLQSLLPLPSKTLSAVS